MTYTNDLYVEFIELINRKPTNWFAATYKLKYTANYLPLIYVFFNTPSLPPGPA